MCRLGHNTVPYNKGERAFRLSHQTVPIEKGERAFRLSHNLVTYEKESFHDYTRRVNTGNSSKPSSW